VDNKIPGPRDKNPSIDHYKLNQCYNRRDSLFGDNEIFAQLDMTASMYHYIKLN